jgi:predicted PurR-regulated permease PerM
VAVLFGSTLFGIVGALLAVPVAASLQVIVREIGNRRAGATEAGERPAEADPDRAPGLT